MPVMKGIVFANYSANFHLISFDFLYNIENVCYNMWVEKNFILLYHYTRKRKNNKAIQGEKL